MRIQTIGPQSGPLTGTEVVWRAITLSLSHHLHRANQVAQERFAKELGDTGLTARQLTVLAAVAADECASAPACDPASAGEQHASSLATTLRRNHQKHLKIQTSSMGLVARGAPCYGS